MSELVSHEIEIAVVAQAESHKPDHFMQGYSPKNPGSFFREDAHSRIDLFVEQPHGDSLIADQSLIVTLSVSDAMFTISIVSQLESDI